MCGRLAFRQRPSINTLLQQFANGNQRVVFAGKRIYLHVQTCRGAWRQCALRLPGKRDFLADRNDKGKNISMVLKGVSRGSSTPDAVGEGRVPHHKQPLRRQGDHHVEEHPVGRIVSLTAQTALCQSRTSRIYNSVQSKRKPAQVAKSSIKKEKRGRKHGPASPESHTCPNWTIGFARWPVIHTQRRAPTISWAAASPEMTSGWDSVRSGG